MFLRPVSCLVQSHTLQCSGSQEMYNLLLLLLTGCTSDNVYPTNAFLAYMTCMTITFMDTQISRLFNIVFYNAFIKLATCSSSSSSFISNCIIHLLHIWKYIATYTIYNLWYVHKARACTCPEMWYIIVYVHIYNNVSHWELCIPCISFQHLKTKYFNSSPIPTQN